MGIVRENTETINSERVVRWIPKVVLCVFKDRGVPVVFAPAK